MLLRTNHSLQERNRTMIAHNIERGNGDSAILCELEQNRREGLASDDDRVVFFTSDERVSLYSAFGHGADDKTFIGIAFANFRAMNPGLV